MLSKVLALLLIVQTAHGSEVISVNNGGKWGEVGEWDVCPRGSVVRGFSLKVQESLVGDNTAVNGIRLYCAKCKPPHDVETITSLVAPWGNWTERQWCKYGRPYRFQLRVEEYREGKDNTAVNNIKFECTDGGELEGDGLLGGTYGEWSEGCRYGICGLKTRVQGSKRSDDAKGVILDNTALNDVRFICCE